MNPLLVVILITRAALASGQLKPIQTATLDQTKQDANQALTQGRVTAFPDSPKAPPPRVKDLQVPAAPVTPGSAPGQSIGANAPLTAEEAVRIALHHQPSLGVKVGAIQTQQGQTWQTGALLHPQLNVGAGYDLIQSLSHVPPGQTVEAPTLVTPPGVSPAFPYSLTADVKQLIFDFNMTRNLVKQSEALERSAQQNLTVAQQELALSVRTDFYNFVDAERLAAVNDANVTARQRQLELAEARLKNGVGEPSDVATAEASKSQAIFQLNVARNTAEQNRIILLQQMGVDPLTPVVSSNESAPEPSEDDAKALTAKAIKLRPEVKAAVEAVAAAKFGMNAARAVNLPAIYAEIGAGFNGSSFPLDNNVANLSVGFQFPLLDGGYRKGAVQMARGQITTADSNLKTAVLQVRTDVASAYMALKSAEQRVGITDNEVFNSREDVRIAEGRYRAGIGLFQDIVTAQELVVTSELDQESARNALDVARTQLRHATGELLADIQ